jgi:DNA repair protein RecN (Recombination protein N)
VEFLFAPNLGSDPKPVGKVASGGELSRLNLCLKSVVSDQMQLPTLVFDEIDAGVSGEVALRMGQKLKSLSQKHQVIMITHSPQIAAQAGHHLQVSKTDLRGRSVARIRPLPPEERVTEIAKMLSGDPPTQAAILNAKTLIET